MDKAYYAALGSSFFAAILAGSYSLPLLQIAAFTLIAAPFGYILYNTIQSIKSFFNQLDQTVGQLNGAIRDVDTAVNNLNRHLNRTTRQLDRLIQNVDEAIPDVRDTVRDTNTTVRTINRTLTDITPTIARTIEGTRQVVEQLNGAAEAIGTYGTLVTAPAAALRRIGRTIIPENPEIQNVSIRPRRSRGRIRP